MGGEAAAAVGHLSGWSPDVMFSYPGFARTTSERPRGRVHWIVRGTGEVVVSAGCTRTGVVSARVALGQVGSASVAPGEKA